MTDSFGDSAGAPKGLLRVLTCGSVDDGKSTLIGRLLLDTGQVPDDQKLSLDTENADEINLADLLDGLAAEREQGITIDVAYRYFDTDKRKFIIADAPGHEQYTRNMATGASTSDLAVLLVDARHGLQFQTRRHAYIASLFGIRHVVMAINKMDLVGFSQQKFNQIEVAFRSFAADLNFLDIQCIPISAQLGDNVARPSQNMPWYRGDNLLSYLEDVDVKRIDAGLDFRFPVQAVNRPDADKNSNVSERSYAGNVCAGAVKLGGKVIVLPSEQAAQIKRITTMDGDLNVASKGQAVSLVLDTEIDVSRGSMICTHSKLGQDLPESSDQIQAHILWMGEGKLFPGRTYLLKTRNTTVSASITELKYKVDVHDLSQHSAKTLCLNEVGVCNLSMGKPILFEPYDRNRTLGSFILIDRQSNATVAAGMIKFSLRRASNIKWQELEVGKSQRAMQKHQKPAVLWFTGLSGSGKSTIASLVEKQLFDMGKHTYTLDGDNVRHGLNKDLGFTDADRIENIRRISETARLMADAGLVVLVSFISPFTAERQMARKLMDEGEFIEIHVNTPLEVAERRDVKGLYAKARAGEIKNFTGIDSAYQPPNNAEITVDTVSFSPEQSADKIVSYLVKNGFVTGL